MGPSSVPSPSLLILDDDLLTREVLSLMAADAGYRVQAFESGDAALRYLDAASAPDAVLIDMQMPGTSGNTLAPLLRAACGPGTVLLAMSATVRQDFPNEDFDAFLLKPFSINELNAILSGAKSQPKPVSLQIDALNESTYGSLAQSMPPEQLLALYMMCLDDADRRIETMRVASATRDADTYRRAAHSIKGGCGMVGALELATLATKMEENPLPEVGDVVSFEVFLRASARLRSILVAHQKNNPPDRFAD